jgi:hypothetical protein
MTDAISRFVPRSFWGRLRFAALLMILIGLIAYVGLDWWSGRRLDASVSHFQDRFGMLQTVVRAPGVSSADNRSRVVRAAAALVNPTSRELRSVVGRLGAVKSSEELTPDLRAFVEANKSAIRLLDGLASRHQSGWDIDYADAAVSDLPYVDVRDLGHALYVSALIDLAEGRADESAASATAGLDVSNSFANEPSLITQLVRIVMGLQQLDVVQRLLAEGDLSRTSLEDLARRLAECRQTDPIRTGLLGEAWSVDVTLARAATGRSWAVASPSAVTGPTRHVALFGRLGRPLIDMARSTYLGQMERLLDLATGPRPRSETAALPAPNWWSLADRIAGTFTPGLVRTIDTGDDFHAALAAAQIAVALRLFRLDRGAYPDSLSALTPAYLDSLPIDPWTGQAPVYTRQGNGFSLHSGRGLQRPVADWVVTK